MDPKNSEESVLTLEKLAKRVDIKVQGEQQVWHVWNPGASERVLLLHGGSGSWTHWLKNIRMLSQNREVWALDLPGFGESGLPPKAIDVDDLVLPVMEGMKEILGSSPIDVLGFSFGGLLAGYIAATDETRIRKLILIGVPALGLTNTPLTLRGLRPEMNTMEIQEVHRNNLKVMMIADERVIDKQTIQIQLHNVERDRLKRRRIARSAVMLELQKKWTCPVYTVWGELDGLYKGQLDQVRQRFQNCDLREFHVIPNAGHWVQYEQPNAFNRCIMKILDSHIAH